jgi:tRNA 2-thiouridine synthesizing protein A
VTGSTAPALELDCRGMRCPQPVIKLANRIDDVPVGAVVAVTADDPAARPDIGAWCRMRGQEYVGETTAEDGVPTFLVRRVV